MPTDEDAGEYIVAVFLCGGDGSLDWKVEAGVTSQTYDTHDECFRRLACEALNSVVAAYLVKRLERVPSLRETDGAGKSEMATESRPQAYKEKKGMRRRGFLECW